MEDGGSKKDAGNANKVEIIGQVVCRKAERKASWEYPKPTGKEEGKILGSRGNKECQQVTWAGALECGQKLILLKKGGMGKRKIRRRPGKTPPLPTRKVIQVRRESEEKKTLVRLSGEAMGY